MMNVVCWGLVCVLRTALIQWEATCVVATLDTPSIGMDALVMVCIQFLFINLKNKNKLGIHDQSSLQMLMNVA